jgi:hypothetical protein
VLRPYYALVHAPAPSTSQPGIRRPPAPGAKLLHPPRRDKPRPLPLTRDDGPATHPRARPRTEAGTTVHRPIRRAALLGLLLTTACGTDPAAVVPACLDAPVLPADELVTAALGPGDPRRGGSYIQYYSVRPTAPAALRLHMTAMSFDPFLFLLDGSGRVIGQGYGADPEAGREASLESIVGPGCYLVGASSWAPASGSYSLLLTWLPGVP